MLNLQIAFGTEYPDRFTTPKSILDTIQRDYPNLREKVRIRKKNLNRDIAYFITYEYANYTTEKEYANSKL